MVCAVVGTTAETTETVDRAVRAWYEVYMEMHGRGKWRVVQGKFDVIQAHGSSVGRLSTSWLAG